MKRKMKKNLVLILVATSWLMLGGLSTALAGETPIVKQDNPTENVSKKNLKKMLLGKAKKWKNGDKVVLATLAGGDTHEKFIKTFAGKTAKQFTNYWRKMVFSGKGKMPKSFDSEEDLAAFVADNKGALGYTTAGVVFDGTRVIEIK